MLKSSVSEPRATQGPLRTEAVELDRIEVVVEHVAAHWCEPERLIGVLECFRWVVHSADVDEHLDRCAPRQPVRDAVGEGHVAVEVLFGVVLEGAVGLERQLTARREADELRRQRVTIGVGVIGEDVTKQQGVLVGPVGVGDRGGWLFDALTLM